MSRYDRDKIGDNDNGGNRHRDNIREKEKNASLPTASPSTSPTSSPTSPPTSYPTLNLLLHPKITKTWSPSSLSSLSPISFPSVVSANSIPTLSPTATELHSTAFPSLSPSFSSPTSLQATLETSIFQSPSPNTTSTWSSSSSYPSPSRPIFITFAPIIFPPTHPPSSTQTTATPTPVVVSSLSPVATPITTDISSNHPSSSTITILPSSLKADSTSNYYYCEPINNNNGTTNEIVIGHVSSLTMTIDFNYELELVSYYDHGNNEYYLTTIIENLGEAIVADVIPELLPHCIDRRRWGGNRRRRRRRRLETVGIEEMISIIDETAECTTMSRHSNQNVCTVVTGSIKMYANEATPVEELASTQKQALSLNQYHMDSGAYNYGAVNDNISRVSYQKKTTSAKSSTTNTTVANDQASSTLPSSQMENSRIVTVTAVLCSIAVLLLGVAIFMMRKKIKRSQKAYDRRLSNFNFNNGSQPKLTTTNNEKPSSENVEENVTSTIHVLKNHPTILNQNNNMVVELRTSSTSTSSPTIERRHSNNSTTNSHASSSSIIPIIPTTPSIRSICSNDSFLATPVASFEKQRTNQICDDALSKLIIKCKKYKDLVSVNSSLGALVQNEICERMQQKDNTAMSTRKLANNTSATTAAAAGTAYHVERALETDNWEQLLQIMAARNNEEEDDAGGGGGLMEALEFGRSEVVAGGHGGTIEDYYYCGDNDDSIEQQQSEESSVNNGAAYTVSRSHC